MYTLNFYYILITFTFYEVFAKIKKKELTLSKKEINEVIFTKDIQRPSGDIIELKMLLSNVYIFHMFF